MSLISKVNILPKKGERNILTSALPYVNNVPHLGPHEDIPGSAPVEKEAVEDMPGMRKGLTQDDYKNQVLVEHSDPNSPIYSVKSFADLGLSEALLKGVTEGAKFDKPSRIQETAFPIILNDPPGNLLAQSQSGTGKTAAFSLGILARCTEEQVPQAMCLCNTHELANQIAGVLETMAQFTSFKVMRAVPGQPRVTSNIKEQIIVGTPGTVKTHIQSKKLRTDKVGHC
jgi:ATP-dependent RNA helicase DDX19/DBP5